MTPSKPRRRSSPEKPSPRAQNNRRRSTRRSSLPRSPFSKPIPAWRSRSAGERKAVIFTESVRTQRYLAELLAANGYNGEIVLMNGQNSDPLSRTAYEDWLARHKGTDAISGSRSADMKAAIVEAFKTQKIILIATESGAEG